MRATPSGETGAGLEYRRLRPEDLDAVVAIDAMLSGGHPRRQYVERRLRAALAAPGLHVQYAAASGGTLCGYALARRLHGEFGAEAPALRLELIGVTRDEQHRGIGAGLFGRLRQWCATNGVGEIRTQASWRNHAMLAWLDGAGFALGRSQVIDCAVADGPVAAGGEVLAPRGSAAGEADFSAPPPNDFDARPGGRLQLRALRADDRAAVARIDRHLTGRDRAGYLGQLFEEALADSAVRVSLVACDGADLLGFVMARTDLGDFGRTEPVAVLDTIGVDPGAGGAGIGRALVSQLFVNLQALRVERVETVIAHRSPELLGFFYRLGFAPSERLAFVRGLEARMP